MESRNSQYKILKLKDNSTYKWLFYAKYGEKNSRRWRKHFTWYLVASVHLAALPFLHHSLFSDQFQSLELDWSEIYKENNK